MACRKPGWVHPLKIPIKGWRSGLLVAEEEIRPGFWRCKCDCGGERVVRADGVRNRSTKHCGCKRRMGVKWEPVLPGDGTAIIPLPQGLFSVIDAEDLPKVRGYVWSVNVRPRTCYAIAYTKQSRGNPRRRVQMHRIIIDAPAGLDVDHRDRNGLNNRRSNLRLCNDMQNSYNKGACGGKSRFKGVYMNRQGTWSAAITINKKIVYLGRFATEEEAARAYDERAAVIQGEFACPNFPPSA